VDSVFDFEGVKVFCDPKSYLFLNGMTLDFSDELLTGGFKFVNPNAKKSCSCGTSFSA
jgi:iron-sulfur cluster assembly protein